MISVAPIFHVPYAKKASKPFFIAITRFTVWRTHTHTLSTKNASKRGFYMRQLVTHILICALQRNCTICAMQRNCTECAKSAKIRGNNKTWQQNTITDESDAEPKNDQNYEKRYQKYDIHFVWQESHFFYSVNYTSAYAYAFAWLRIDKHVENNGGKTTKIRKKILQYNRTQVFIRTLWMMKWQIDSQKRLYSTLLYCTITLCNAWQIL